MEYWLAWFGQDNEDTVPIARAAEEMGFTGVALPDHVAIPVDYTSQHPSGRRVIFHDSNYPDALITIATMAAVTTRLRFMTYSYVLTMREPFSVAKQVATLADQSKGRFSFGVGAGWNEEEIALLGHDPRTRGRRLDSMLDILRDLWDDGIAEHHDEFHVFGPVGQFPIPRRRIPVWVGGSSPAALRRAARHDGWLGLNQSREELREIVRRLADERRTLAKSRAILHEAFQIAVLPDEIYSPQVFADLGELGVTASVIRAWDTESRAFSSLDSKLEAMTEFRERILRSASRDGTR